MRLLAPPPPRPLACFRYIGTSPKTEKKEEEKEFVPTQLRPTTLERFRNIDRLLHAFDQLKFTEGFIFISATYFVGSGTWMIIKFIMMLFLYFFVFYLLTVVTAILSHSILCYSPPPPQQHVN